MNPAITPVSHDEDDFTYSQRLIDEARGSLHKRTKLTVGEPTVSSVGRRTLDAILNTGVETASDAIGPSSYYTGTEPLTIGRIADLKGSASFISPRPDFIAHDLLYRPNDRISLDDIQRAHKTLQTASVNYANGTGTTPSAQVGGDHYGDPATDVYAFSMANKLDPMQFNIVKYVTRFRKKDGMKDLKKAMQTLERLIAHEEGRK